MDIPIIKIMAEPQIDPNQCKFMLEKPLFEGGSFRFQKSQGAQGSALAQELFAIPEVDMVAVSAKVITVTKSSMDDWREIGRKIGLAIRQAIASGQPVISQEMLSRLPSEEEIKAKIKEILDREINPAVASHGGHIELLDVKRNDAFVRMSGGCQGCASSQATLKQGVEESIRKAIPEFGMLYDTTDHAAGQNPYYAG